VDARWRHGAARAIISLSMSSSRHVHARKPPLSNLRNAPDRPAAHTGWPIGKWDLQALLGLSGRGFYWGGFFLFPCSLCTFYGGVGLLFFFLGSRQLIGGGLFYLLFFSHQIFLGLGGSFCLFSFRIAMVCAQLLIWPYFHCTSVASRLGITI
jgi:hypothetical protein